MENLMKDLEVKFTNGTIDSEDFIILLNRIDETTPSRNLDVWNLVTDILEVPTDKTRFLDLVKSDLLYEFLLDSDVHVGLFAVTAYLYYTTHYNSNLRVALPSISKMQEEAGQETYNYLLREIVKAEVIL